jgi:hypothetical protein
MIINVFFVCPGILLLFTDISLDLSKLLAVLSNTESLELLSTKESLKGGNVQELHCHLLGMYFFIILLEYFKHSVWK